MCLWQHLVISLRTMKFNQQFFLVIYILSISLDCTITDGVIYNTASENAPMKGCSTIQELAGDVNCCYIMNDANHAAGIWWI